MSHHQPRGGHPEPNYRDGEYTATAGGETIVPIQGPGATGTTGRLRRSASVEHNPDSYSEKPPIGSSRTNVASGHAYGRDDNFFNEKITLPRVGMNEREEIRDEGFDNVDRGSLDNEEQSYDRTVRYSQARSGSLPARRFEQRSSYFDWANEQPRDQYFESRTYGHQKGAPLADAPWSDFESRRQLQQRSEAADQSQFSKQTVHQTMEKSHNESHERGRHYYGGQSRRERYSGGGGGGGYAYEEWHDGDGAVAPYYRPEHTSTLRGASSSKHQARQAQYQHEQQQQQQYGAQYGAGGASSYSHHRSHHQHASSGGEGAAAISGGRGHRYGHSQSWGYQSGGKGGYYKERKYRRINCCCFPCIWPPWGYEETHAPRPLYYSPPPKHL